MQRPVVVVDRSLPFLKGFLDRFVSVHYLPNEAITNDFLKSSGANAILCRSVLNCNPELLEGTAVQFIASATAGFDHVDVDYCRDHDIFFAHAPGCNATAVASYVFAVLAERAIALRKPLGNESLGIVGVGHVGGEVKRFADAIGISCMLCDPPRQCREGSPAFRTIEELLRSCDIVSFHVPLTRTGDYPTYHLLNETLISECHPSTLIINAARGAVIETNALISALRNKSIEDAIVDCWEGEPQISTTLLPLVARATPHIAGFSAESKSRGSQMVAEALFHYFNITSDVDGKPINYNLLLPPKPSNAIIDASHFGPFTIEHCLLHGIKLSAIDSELRSNTNHFEALRINYQYHREPSSFCVRGASESFHSSLRKLGFHIIV